MQTIKLDCPYCSMDHGVSYVPGWQSHYCHNCTNTFVVHIDDQGRVNVYKKESLAPPRTRYTDFTKQLRDVLTKQRWEFLGGSPRDLAFVGRLDKVGLTYFLGVSNGDKHQSAREVSANLDDFYQFVETNAASFVDLSRGFSGQLLLTFRNVFETDIDDASRELERNAFWRRIDTSVGVFDFCTQRYFDSKTRFGKQWNSILPPLLARVKLT